MPAIGCVAFGSHWAVAQGSAPPTGGAAAARRLRAASGERTGVSGVGLAPGLGPRQRTRSPS